MHFGYMEDEVPRMVKTPWSEEEMPFEQAAEIGTKKVIKKIIKKVPKTEWAGTTTPVENKSYLEESIKSVNQRFADTKLITTPYELNNYLKNNKESRVVYDIKNNWYLVGNAETSIHINLINDAFVDGYYQPFEYNGKWYIYSFTTCRIIKTHSNYLPLFSFAYILLSF